jgi:hypothetical protein
MKFQIVPYQKDEKQQNDGSYREDGVDCVLSESQQNGLIEIEIIDQPLMMQHILSLEICNQPFRYINE